MQKEGGQVSGWNLETITLALSEFILWSYNPLLMCAVLAHPNLLPLPLLRNILDEALSVRLSLPLYSNTLDTKQWFFLIARLDIDDIQCTWHTFMSVIVVGLCVQHYSCYCVHLWVKYSVIGASLSEPHTNQHYEKIAVLMYLQWVATFLQRQLTEHQAHALQRHRLIASQIWIQAFFLKVTVVIQG